MSASYYVGFHWGTFLDPVQALTEANFSEEFAHLHTRTATETKPVFVARGDQYGVTLVKTGTCWNRFHVRFRPLYSTAKEARHEAKRMAAASDTPHALASYFEWTGPPPTESPRDDAAPDLPN